MHNADVHEKDYARNAFYMHRKVTVFQSVDSDGFWEESSVSWSSFRPDNLEEVEAFAAVLQAAVALARQWDEERAGKKVEEK